MAREEEGHGASAVARVIVSARASVTMAGAVSQLLVRCGRPSAGPGDEAAPCVRPAADRSRLGAAGLGNEGAGARRGIERVVAASSSARLCCASGGGCPRGGVCSRGQLPAVFVWCVSVVCLA